MFNVKPVLTWVLMITVGVWDHGRPLDYSQNGKEAHSKLQHLT